MYNIKIYRTDDGGTSESAILYKINGKSYTLLIVDKGLYFPSLSYVREVILKHQLNGQTDAVVVDCSYFSGFDYTAIKELSVLVHDLNEQGQKLYLLNVTDCFVELCNTVGHCENITDYSFANKEDLEVSLFDYKEDKVSAVIEEFKVKECVINASDVKTIKEIHPLLNDQPSKENGV